LSGSVLYAKVMLSTKEFNRTNSASIKSWDAHRALRAPGSSAEISTGEPYWASLKGWIPSVPNDEEVNELARKGGIDAFGKLIQRHTGMCTRQALLIMHSLNDAEDVVQRAFRKAFQYREQFHGDGAFAAWLGLIVENECLCGSEKKETLSLSTWPTR
jgi:Sigma-70 region 2